MVKATPVTHRFIKDPLPARRFARRLRAARATSSRSAAERTKRAGAVRCAGLSALDRSHAFAPFEDWFR
jgi:hypothetical protein